MIIFNDSMVSQLIIFSLLIFHVCFFSILGAVMAVVRKVLRDAWDTVIFRCMIGSCARVPLSDNFLARRIAGPGMASTYYFQIKTEQALAALETAMDLDRLQVYHVSCDF